MRVGPLGYCNNSKRLLIATTVRPRVMPATAVSSTVAMFGIEGQLIHTGEAKISLLTVVSDLINTTEMDLTDRSRRSLVLRAEGIKAMERTYHHGQLYGLLPQLFLTIGSRLAIVALAGWVIRRRHGNSVGESISEDRC